MAASAITILDVLLVVAFQACFTSEPWRKAWSVLSATSGPTTCTSVHAATLSARPATRGSASAPCAACAWAPNRLEIWRLRGFQSFCDFSWSNLLFYFKRSCMYVYIMWQWYKNIVDKLTASLILYIHCWCYGHIFHWNKIINNMTLIMSISFISKGTRWVRERVTYR